MKSTASEPGLISLLPYFLEARLPAAVRENEPALLPDPGDGGNRAYTSGYLLQTPDNSNFFRFPLKVRVIGSQL